jgi:hypothetical protein
MAPKEAYSKGVAVPTKEMLPEIRSVLHQRALLGDADARRYRPEMAEKAVQGVL